MTGGQIVFRNVRSDRLTPARWIVTTPEFGEIIRVQELADVARDYDLSIVVAPDQEAAFSRATAALEPASEASPNPITLVLLPVDYGRPTGRLDTGPHNIPVVAIGLSWLENRVRFEAIQATDGAVRTLASVIAGDAEEGEPFEEPDIDPQEIASAAPALTMTEPGSRQLGIGTTRRRLLGTELELTEDAGITEEDVAAVAASLGWEIVPTDDTMPGVPPLLLVWGDDPLGYRGLAAGADVLVIGSADIARVGLAEAVTDRAGLEAALARRLETTSRRPNRTVVRRMLALDLMAVTVASTAAAIARALSGIADRIVRPPPTVSILINNYNYGRYLAACIESARAQTKAPCEIIVVDDGSTDDSREIIGCYPDVRAILKPNGGQASAFNAGFMASTGDVIIFLDSDDRLKPDAVEVIGRSWRRGYSRLHYRMDMIDAEGRIGGMLTFNVNTHSDVVLGPMLATGYHYFMPTSGNAFSREALQRVMPMPEAEWRICSDLYLMLTTALLGRVGRIEQPLSEYRVHGANSYFAHDLFQIRRTTGKAPLHIQGWHAFATAISRYWTGAGGPTWRLNTLRRACAAELDQTISRRALVRIISRYAATVAIETGAPLRHRTALIREAFRRLRDRLAGRRRPFSEIGNRTPLEPSQDDLISRAGEATWQVLRPGRLVDLRHPIEARRLFGNGWIYAPEGVRLDGAYGAISFTVPDDMENAYVDIETTVSGPTSMFEVYLNGRLHDRRWLAGGRLRLHVPDESLNQRLFGMRICHLELVRSRHDVDLTVTRFVLRYAAPSNGRFHLAREGKDFAVKPGHPGVALLGRGFDWPTVDGAAFNSLSAVLAFGVERIEAATLELVFERPWPEHAVGSARVETEDLDLVHSRDRSTIYVSLEAEDASPHGELTVSLERPGLSLGTSPPRLTEVRLIPVRNGQLRSVRPASWHGLLNEADGVTSEGLTAGEGLGGDLLGSATIRLILPPVPDPFRIGLMAALADHDPGAEILVRCGDRSVRLRLGRMNVIHLPVPPSCRDLVTLHVARIGGTLPVSLVSAQLEIVRERTVARPASVVPGYAAGADRLWEAATDPLEWHSPAEGLLWLAGPVGSLALDLAPDGRPLAVTLLVPPDLPRRVTIRCMGRSVSAMLAGSQVLRLSLPADRQEERATLTVEIDGIVAIERLDPSSSGRMLGCALMEVALT